jgi:hypothetical protein
MLLESKRSIFIAISRTVDAEDGIEVQIVVGIIAIAILRIDGW